MSMVRVALADDHRVVSRSLQAFLESFPDLQVVGAASSGEELLERLDSWRPDVIVQDLLMPGGIDGLETTRRVLARAPGVRVVALTASTDEARMMGVLRVGATGYVRKDAEPETLLAAIRAVAAGRTYIDPSIGRLVPRGENRDELTARERDVLRHLALGRANREIAAALGVSEETVKTHVAHVLSKLQVENRAQAAVQALRQGLVSFEDLA
ncbi:MAG TPA: response regulator transcription factor [Gemmatimonadales bacterium]|nr:response regulator transcription factor [Gemmatimonadales bacterium]